MIFKSNNDILNSVIGFVPPNRYKRGGDLECIDVSDVGGNMTEKDVRIPTHNNDFCITNEKCEVMR